MIDLPRLRIIHTSDQTIGQVYVPFINWALMVGVLVLVFAFRSSAALAYAFGMAVTATIAITTLLFFYLVRYRWHQPWWVVIAGATSRLRSGPKSSAASWARAWSASVFQARPISARSAWRKSRRKVRE